MGAQGGVDAIILAVQSREDPTIFLCRKYVVSFLISFPSGQQPFLALAMPTVASGVS